MLDDCSSFALHEQYVLHIYNFILYSTRAHLEALTLLNNEVVARVPIIHGPPKCKSLPWSVVLVVPWDWYLGYSPQATQVSLDDCWSRSWPPTSSDEMLFSARPAMELACKLCPLHHNVEVVAFGESYLHCLQDRKLIVTLGKDTVATLKVWKKDTEAGKPLVLLRTLNCLAGKDDQTAVLHLAVHSTGYRLIYACGLSTGQIIILKAGTGQLHSSDLTPPPFWSLGGPPASGWGLQYSHTETLAYGCILISWHVWLLEEMTSMQNFIIN